MATKADANQITREYFDSLLIETRYLDAKIPSTKMQLWGEEFETPIMTAALSHLGNVCENGMVKLAEAAKMAGAVYWCGMGDETELESITAIGAKTVKIIKPYENNEDIFRKIEHAVKAGVFAVGMDIDHSFNGNGDYDCVLGYKMRAKSTQEMKAFVEASPVPFVVKGVLSVQDARKCMEAGVSGIVVSHHHGIMDYSIPPLMILEKIVREVDGRMEIFVDCGIESGMDAFKALALGAKAVSVGRDLMKPLKDGSESAAMRIRELNGQLASVMARTCAETLGDIDSSVIWHRNF